MINLHRIKKGVKPYAGRKFYGYKVDPGGDRPPFVVLSVSGLTAGGTLGTDLREYRIHEVEELDDSEGVEN